MPFITDVTTTAVVIRTMLCQTIYSWSSDQEILHF